MPSVKEPPDHLSERDAVEQRVYAFLNKTGVSYLRADHPAAATMEDCRAPEEALHAPICKNLFLCNRQQTKFYLLLIPSDKPFKTKYLSEQIGSSRLSFAPGEQMVEKLGTQPGSASVFSLLNDTARAVELLIDRDLLKEEAIGCHPCRNTSTLRLTMDDVLHVVLPAMGRDPVFVTLPWETE